MAAIRMWPELPALGLVDEQADPEPDAPAAFQTNNNKEDYDYDISDTDRCGKRL